ncbi:MAG: sulfotransferase family 2 domain-containing protein [Candidatus Delongbacteria bacterium]|nr:sulfotransferase family 2 domain-containing protein [Candidatus Delongbacteria bacterium]
MENSIKAYDPKRPLISIHIPKCAGSSFSDVLKLWFKKGYLCHYHNGKTNTHPPKHRLEEGFFRKRQRQGLCIHGHFDNYIGNGVRNYYPGADQFITVMRDPFDLHVSTYFYVKREAHSNGVGAYRSGKLHPIIENQWNLVDFLENIKKSYLLRFLPPEITQDNYETILASQFLYIGISEQLQKSVDILASILGFQTVRVPVKNVSEWNETIPDGAREVFEKNNPLQVAIYKYAYHHWGNSE